MAGWCFFASSQRRGEENDLISLLFSFNTLIFPLFFLSPCPGRPARAGGCACLFARDEGRERAGNGRCGIDVPRSSLLREQGRSCDSLPLSHDMTPLRAHTQCNNTRIMLQMESNTSSFRPNHGTPKALKSLTQSITPIGNKPHKFELVSEKKKKKEKNQPKQVIKN